MRYTMKSRAIESSIAALLAFAGFAATQSAQAADKFVVAVGSPVPVISLIVEYVGQAAGLFAEENLDVEVQYTTGAPQATQLAVAGRANVARGTIEPVILGVDKGVTGKAFLATNTRLVYYIAVPKNSSIKTIADFKGKKIGVSSLSAASVPVVKSILRIGGVPFTRDDILPVGSTDQAISALTSGRVDALGLFSGAYYGLERAGQEFRYFEHPTLKDLGNGVLFASDSQLAGNKAQLCRFGKAFVRAALFANTNPEAAVRMFWKVSPASKRTGVDDKQAMAFALAELLPLLKDLDFGFPPAKRWGTFRKDAMQKYVEVLREDGLIKDSVDVNRIVTEDLIGCINDFDPAPVRAKATAWEN